MARKLGIIQKSQTSTEAVTRLAPSILEDSRRFVGDSWSTGPQSSDSSTAKATFLRGLRFVPNHNRLQELQDEFRPFDTTYSTNLHRPLLPTNYARRASDNKGHRHLHDDEDDDNNGNDDDKKDPWDTFQHPTINHPKAHNHAGTTNADIPVDNESAANESQQDADDTMNGAQPDDDGGDTTRTRVPSAMNDPSLPADSASESMASKPSSSSTSCHSLSCRTLRVVTNPFVFVALALAMLYFYVRKRSRRGPSHGAYRAVAAQYVSSAFDEELSPDDYLSDDEADEFWTHGKKSIEMGTFKDDLTLDEVNG